MRRTAVLFAGLALMASAAVSGEGNVRRNSRHIPGRYIVALEAGADAAGMANELRNLNGQVKHTYRNGFKGLAVEITDAQAQSLARDARVQFVEEDATITKADTTWALDRVDQRLQPLNGTYVSDGDGAGIKVYVVDTGILATHTDFGGRVAPGFTAIVDDKGTSDCNGHGTHVAGLIGGSTYGVAKGVTLVPVRVLDCDGSGSVSNLLAGLDWILNDHAQSGLPAVVNMSLGGDASSALDTQVNNVITAGMATVVAAGNNNMDACATSPARVAAALTVGASTETDERASFSNYGVCVDLFAPGTNVLSDWFTSDTAAANGNGTSSSAPFVTGSAALLLQKFPAATPAAISTTIKAQATTDLLGSIGDGSPNRLLFSLISTLNDPADQDSQLLADPSFEYGETFWTSDICSVINPTGCPPTFELLSAPSHTGNKHAAIGGPPQTFHLTSETVMIPNNVTRAELSVYLWVVSKNKKSSAEDVLTIEIRDANGGLLETVGTFSNLDKCDTYLRRTFDVTQYHGATIRISFTGVQKPGPPTWFLLDDVALNIWR